MHRIPVQQLAEGDLVSLQKVLTDGFTLPKLVKAGLENRIQIWGFGEALVVTEILNTVRGKKLFVLWLAGRGIAGRMADLIEELREVAEDFECESIGTMTTRPGSARLCERIGAREIAREFEYEVNNGKA